MSTRLTADERRDEVVAAATIEFATGGFAATSTESIARRAGVSQPYLFQLFGTKRELFLAAVRDCFERTGQRFDDTARAAKASGSDTNETLLTMGEAYVRLLLGDRNLLRLQLHAYAACSDPDVREVVREEFVRLWQRVARASGADPKDLHPWFAQGMLINVIASIGATQTLEDFNAFVCGDLMGMT